jgi:magnesium chelatase family protein
LDSEKTCTCSHAVVGREQKRISGPPLDRIDIRVEVARVQYEKLSVTRQGEPCRWSRRLRMR